MSTVFRSKWLSALAPSGTFGTDTVARKCLKLGTQIGSQTLDPPLDLSAISAESHLAACGQIPDSDAADAAAERLAIVEEPAASWSLDGAYRMANTAIEAASRGRYNAVAFRAFDIATTEAFALRDMEAVRRAVGAYRDTWNEESRP